MSESAKSAVLPAVPLPMDFSASTDADLFDWMAEADKCEADAHAAFAEFHRRHAKYLFTQCERKYGNEAEEIAAETLRRIYYSAPQFDGTKLHDVADAQAARRLVRAWVGQLIKWVAADHIAKRKVLPQPVTPERISSLPDLRCPESEEPPGADSELIEAVRKVIIGLPEREQAIAWMIAHSWSPEHGCVRWSPEELDAIGERFGMTRENIRQVRNRLIQKLRTLLTPLL